MEHDKALEAALESDREAVRKRLGHAHPSPPDRCPKSTWVEVPASGDGYRSRSFPAGSASARSPLRAPRPDPMSAASSRRTLVSPARGTTVNDETDWGHVTIKSIKAQSLDEQIFVAVVFGNYVGPLGIGKEPLSERDHFFHRRFDRRFIEAQGVNEASYGAQRISFCADRAAVEVTLARIPRRSPSGTRRSRRCSPSGRTTWSRRPPSRSGSRRPSTNPGSRRYVKPPWSDLWELGLIPELCPECGGVWVPPSLPSPCVTS